MKKARVALVLAAAMLLVSACGGGGDPRPAAINEATDKCDACNMQVKDDGFATQLITKDKRVYKFDDIGCMNKWKTENPGAEIAIEFVRDHETLEWVKAENAFYAYDPSFQTPMAYGIVSFRDKASAEKFVADHGTGVVMDWAQLQNHTWERHKDNAHGGMHGDGEGHGDGAMNGNGDAGHGEEPDAGQTEEAHMEGQM
ncbi:MAG TPA: nitrous oxide reductase accessory protein NosL [Paenibacillaceae bacterium]